MVKMSLSISVLIWTVYFNSLVFSVKYSGNNESPKYWRDEAKAELLRAQNLVQNIAVAKNVIMFLGDGMGVSTVTAARILKGQLNNKTGEETILSFEKFPHVAMSKTYNQDAQVADSAGTATAYLCGIKANYGTCGVDARTIKGDCASSKGAEVTSIMDWSMAKGKSVGIVTTTRITHASPASGYAHAAERDWESDADMLVEGKPGDCKDIARQLIEDNIDIQVILGGGRRSFLRYNDTDPEGEDLSENGRKDNRNLILAWENQQNSKGRKYKYVWNATEFRRVDTQDTDYLLGLFGSSHMQYELERDNEKEPSLTEMTEKAIEMLKKNENGYFLFVEGGRIDHGHHDSSAKKALIDAIAFEEAIQKAADITNQSETLIVVTADHSHVFTIGGYPKRGNPVFGKVDDWNARNGSYAKAKDGFPFTSLLYANGPGYNVTNGTRQDVSSVDTGDAAYIQQSAVPLGWETHGGEEVPIYASGPMAHLFHGVHEQHYIPHVMAYASCVGEYSDDKDCAQAAVNALNRKPCTANDAQGLPKLHLLHLLIAVLITFIQLF